MADVVVSVDISIAEERLNMTPSQINQVNNHPKPGAIISADPIRSLDDVNKIKEMLKHEPRNLAIFIIGINTGFRASDLCRLTIGDVRKLKVGDEFTFRMKKTRGKITVFWNKACVQAVKDLLEHYGNEYEDVYDDMPLFVSRKASDALLVPTLSNLVKEWCRKAGLRGNYSSHTLRKTFGLIHRTVFKTDRDVICKLLGHRTYESLDAYLGIHSDEKKAAYLKEI